MTQEASTQMASTEVASPEVAGRPAAARRARRPLKVRLLSRPSLAANHALTVAPMIARGVLDQDLVAPFSARRFHVSQAG